MFEGKIVLITGGTGSLGQALTKRLLKTNVEKIRIFSRGELKQIQMESELKDERLRFMLGDVRDKDRLSRALEDVDIVIHAAALKHVPKAEYNPFEVVKTNVYGTQNVIDACIDNNVKVTIGIGTDKAVSPHNTYGASKLLMERLFIAADYWKGNTEIHFTCVRYGNVLGSSGSLVPLLVEQINSGKKITITNESMTRLHITMNQALDLIFRALEKGVGGEIFVPKLKAYKVGDMKDAILDLMEAKNEVENIAPRSGEKYHELLISKDEIRNAYDSEEDYIVVENKDRYEKHIGKKLVNANLVDEYSSNNSELLSQTELKNILTEENLVK
jgi:UDP-N-acetylglucosamine 4,6-dehydratase/5-epimerase